MICIPNFGDHLNLPNVTGIVTINTHQHFGTQLIVLTWKTF